MEDFDDKGRWERKQRSIVTADTWGLRRRAGIRERKALVEKVLAGPPRYLPSIAAVADKLVLTPKQREVFDLIYGYRLSQREAATRLGIAHASLRTRLEQVNKKLERLGVGTIGGYGRSNVALTATQEWQLMVPGPDLKRLEVPRT